VHRGGRRSAKAASAPLRPPSAGRPRSIPPRRQPPHRVGRDRRRPPLPRQSLHVRTTSTSSEVTPASSPPPLPRHRPTPIRPGAHAPTGVPPRGRNNPSTIRVASAPHTATTARAPRPGGVSSETAVDGAEQGGACRSGQSGAPRLERFVTDSKP
jgi:hypothetical protein